MKLERKLIAAAVVAVLTALLGASGSQAQKQETAEYHPNQETRGFGTTDGGWTNDSAEAGSCALQLSCPSLTNSHLESDGVDGEADGHIRTEHGGLLGVAGEVTGIWTSPPFTYEGFNGEEPESVEFSLFRRADVDAFLSITEHEAEYTVELIDNTSGGVALTLIPATTLEGADDWTETPAVEVDQDQLTMGNSYSFQITSRFQFGSDVVPGSVADYDNIVLTAKEKPLLNGACANIMRGTNGKDKLRGSVRGDQILAFKKADSIKSRRGADCVKGHAGDDTIRGGGGKDELRGNAGNDVVRGGKGKDGLFGGAGDDNVKGLVGNDLIKGNSGDDELRGNAGRDEIRGGAGNDTLHGGKDNDRFFARGLGRDTIKCGPGRDKVFADRRDKISRSCERVRIK